MSLGLVDLEEKLFMQMRTLHSDAIMSALTDKSADIKRILSSKSL